MNMPAAGPATEANFERTPPAETLDFDRSPYIVIWEMTRACALKCVHCRAAAMDRRSPDELTHAEARLLLDEIRRFGSPLVVLTGGDPLRRPDAKEVVRYGSQTGLRMAMTPSGTGEVTPGDIRDLKDAGLARLAVSLDGPSAPVHDAFRKVDGSFDWTLNIIRWANRAGLPVQINTTVTRHNRRHFEAMADLLESLNIVLWSVFFLVPMGRGRLEDEISASEYEEVFHQMADLSRRASFDIKSTEAPHYRRVLAQRKITPNRSAAGAGRAARGVNDGKGFVFVSHTGEIYPSGFLPISAGNVKRDSLTDVYRNSDIFKTLRDPSRLKDKCGACEYKSVCGGSRARAYAVHGDMTAADPFCVHIPKGYPITEREKAYW